MRVFPPVNEMQTHRFPSQVSTIVRRQFSHHFPYTIIYLVKTTVKLIFLFFLFFLGGGGGGGGLNTV